MKIYPAIDLIHGEVVRLTEGDFNQKTTYDHDPLTVAKKFESSGADHLHVVDLDGAKAGKPMQTAIFLSIVKHTNLKLQVGGGIRERSHVKELLDIGIDRVIIGSLAVKNPSLTRELFQEFGAERLTLGLDIRMSDQGVPMVATHGWQETSNLSAQSVLESLLDLGLDQVLCTDISRDGTMTEPNFALYRQLSHEFPQLCFLASGGVSRSEHLRRLKADEVGGAIIGRALYEGTISVEEALQC